MVPYLGMNSYRRSRLSPFGALVLLLTVSVHAGPAAQKPDEFELALGSFQDGGEGISDTTLMLEHRIMPSRASYTEYVRWNHGAVTVAPQLPVKMNEHGDLVKLCSVIFMYGFACLCCAVVASVLRLRYPKIFSNNILRAIAPAVPNDIQNSYLGWFYSAWALDIDDVQRTAGLDAAMLLEFCDLGMKLMLIIGAPMLICMVPVYALLGDGAAGDDSLSWIGMGNIREGSWLYWVVALQVWYVVIITQTTIFAAQQKMLKRHVLWLRQLPADRATTVLVEGIPEKYQSDARLKEFFSDVYSADAVVSAYVVRKTRGLAALVDTLKHAEQALLQAEFQWEKDGKDKEKRPQHRNLSAKLVDTIDWYQLLVRESQKQVDTEKARIKTLVASNDQTIFSSNAFVTFRTRTDACIAVTLEYDPDDSVFVMSTPPCPDDIIYSDLQEDPTYKLLFELIGYACVLGSYFAFFPVVFGISAISNLESMRSYFPIVDTIVTNYPSMKVTLEGLLATLGLQIFLSFYPSLLKLIFDNFFCLKCRQLCQSKIQIFYFWFLLFFVVFVTAMGNSFLQTVEDMADNPTMIFTLFASSVPQTTHYYMNFVVLQPFTHFLNLMRYPQVGKYLAFKVLCDDERARELAEPEDPAYYGIGSRCARFTIILVIGLVYGTLSPLLCVFVFVNFFVCRIIYGYLMVFAEGPKSDFGGQGWLHQLSHVLVGLICYAVLMVGVIFLKGANHGPGILASGAFVYSILSLYKFNCRFTLENLPYPMLKSLEANAAVDYARAPMRSKGNPAYRQPELVD